MLVSKKKVFLYVVLFAIQVMVVLLIALNADSQSNFLVNLFYDRLFTFILIPLYLYGAANVDVDINYLVVLRIGSRKNGMIKRLKFQYGYGLLFWIMWFSVIAMFSFLFFGTLENFVSIKYAVIFLKYYIGSVMISNLLLILNSSNSKFLSENSYIIIYLLFIIEVLVIVSEVKMQTPIEVFLFFSWIIYGEYVGVLVLFVYSMLLLRYIFKISIRKDIM